MLARLLPQSADEPILLFVSGQSRREGLFKALQHLATEGAWAVPSSRTLHGSKLGRDCAKLAAACGMVVGLRFGQVLADGHECLMLHAIKECKGLGWTDSTECGNACLMAMKLTEHVTALLRTARPSTSCGGRGDEAETATMVGSGNGPCQFQSAGVMSGRSRRLGCFVAIAFEMLYCHLLCGPAPPTNQLVKLGL